MAMTIDYTSLGAQGPSEALGCVPKSMTPVERIARTLSEARELSSRVCGIVDNLVGSRPEAEGKGDRLTAVPGGILTSLAGNAEDTITELRRANDELSRLSRVLGSGFKEVDHARQSME